MRGVDMLEPESKDRLARKQRIIEQYGSTPYQLAERIMALEDQLGSSGDELKQERDSPPCGFPEHRHFKWGHVTHMRTLTIFEDHALEMCEVCGNVRATQMVPLA